MIDLRYLDANGEFLQNIQTRNRDFAKFLDATLPDDGDTDYVVFIRPAGVETDDVVAVVQERDVWRRRAVECGWNESVEFRLDCHRALVDALHDVADVLGDPDWMKDCHNLRDAIARCPDCSNLESAPSMAEVALFWRWRSQFDCASWLMLNDNVDAEVSKYWPKWRRSGRLLRRHYEP